MNHLFLVPNNQEQTMTSRQIADLVEARHDSVKRTIERLAESGVIIRPPMVDEQMADDMGRPRTTSVYQIGKRDSYVIVAQLSPEFTARLVDRWQELEGSAPAPRVLSTMEILELAMTSERERIRLEGELAIAAPKADFVDRYVASTSGNKGFRQVCKLLEAKEPAFREFLKKEGIMYELGGEWVPYGKHLDAGRFVLRAGTADNSGHAYNTAKFTPKGINWVAGEWAKFNLRGAA